MFLFWNEQKIHKVNWVFSILWESLDSKKSSSKACTLRFTYAAGHVCYRAAAWSGLQLLVVVCFWGLNSFLDLSLEITFLPFRGSILRRQLVYCPGHRQELIAQTDFFLRLFEYWHLRVVRKGMFVEQVSLNSKLTLQPESRESPVLDILRYACKKRDLDENRHRLKHHKTLLDNSLSIR